MSKSCKSLYFLTFVLFSQNEVFPELFFIHIIHIFETLDFTGFVGNFFLLFFTFLCYNLGRADG